MRVGSRPAQGAEGEARSHVPAVEARKLGSTHCQQGQAKCPGVRHPGVYLLCTCVFVARGRQCGREGKAIQLKPIRRAGPIPAEGAPYRHPEKALALGSQHEYPSVSPASHFPRKLVL